MYDVIALGELLIDFASKSVDAAGYPTMAANPGGAPGNFLAALNAFGAKTAFLGKVGDDAFGHLLLGLIQEILNLLPALCSVHKVEDKQHCRHSKLCSCQNILAQCCRCHSKQQHCDEIHTYIVIEQSSKGFIHKRHLPILIAILSIIANHIQRCNLFLM